MPTVLIVKGYRFFFYSFDCNEPKHVHIQRDKVVCKFWLQPVSLSKNHGFSPKELNAIRQIINSNRDGLLEAWNEHIAVSAFEARLTDVRVTEDEIIAHLADGRTISVPLAWSWRLSEATPGQRSNFVIIGDGQGVHWPEIDEDISVEGMLCGSPARRPEHSYGPRQEAGKSTVRE